MKLCSIASGSSGNCIFAGSEKTSLLVDAGISGKRIEFGLNEIDRTTADIDGILVTHEHSDHIKGLGVVVRKYKIPIYATAGTIGAIMEMGTLGKLPEGIFHEIKEDEPCVIKDITVFPFAISHDGAQPVGYRLENGGRKIGIATDMGQYNDYIIENLKGLDGLLLEANHDVNMLQVGSYPYYLKQRILGKRGHLSNESAGQLLCRLLHDGMKKILLGHLSRENNYEALAFETVCAEITMGDNPYAAGDFDISVAGRDGISQMAEV
ncbi:MAG: MBL fold metallo-hydrolase [Ruminococcus sp.]|jgi:phosphoribosyl 1,2-cyclic phosphodiesterase